ncbi:MAG: hypothetical protein JWQ11_828, partial [Rhizobacter sp.]|nr:hypothetical protein [Rhizobacter sp.]
TSAADSVASPFAAPKSASHAGVNGATGASKAASVNPELILQRLEWTVLRKLDGLLHGDYRTLFRGFGMDLADLREYQFNDDVRHIDWNVTARMDTPYVREFNEDREVTVWFVLDLSPSVDFGSGDVKKRTIAAEFVTVLAQVMSRNGNRIGAVFYGGAMDKVIPARTGRRQVLHILNTMLARPELKQSPVTDLTAFLSQAFAVMPRRSVVFVVSDFISAAGWERPLAHLARRHETMAVRLYDPLEMELPNLGLITIQDSETGEQLFVDTNDRGFRKRFAAAADKRETDLRAAFGQAGVDTIELSTQDDLLDTLMRFADLRKRRTQLSAGATFPKHLNSIEGTSP